MCQLRACEAAQMKEKGTTCEAAVVQVYGVHVGPVVVGRDGACQQAGLRQQAALNPGTAGCMHRGQLCDTTEVQSKHGRQHMSAHWHVGCRYAHGKCAATSGSTHPTCLGCSRDISSPGATPSRAGTTALSADVKQRPLQQPAPLTQQAFTHLTHLLWYCACYAVIWDVEIPAAQGAACLLCSTPAAFCVCVCAKAAVRKLAAELSSSQRQRSSGRCTAPCLRSASAGAFSLRVHLAQRWAAPEVGLVGRPVRWQRARDVVDCHIDKGKVGQSRPGRIDLACASAAE